MRPEERTNRIAATGHLASTWQKSSKWPLAKIKANKGLSDAEQYTLPTLQIQVFLPLGRNEEENMRLIS